MPLFHDDSLGQWIFRGLTEGSSADDELIDDPEALVAAQAAANGRQQELPRTEGWEAVAGPVVFSVGSELPGVLAAQITMPLDAAEIQYAWDPYPPAEMPLALEPYGRLASRKFTLLVPPEDAGIARDLLEPAPATARPAAMPGAPSAPYHTPAEQPGHPFVLAALIGVALSAIVAAVYYGYGALK